MYIYLTHIDPENRKNRWYEISVQPTLFDKVAVIRRWGSRQTSMLQILIMPMASLKEAHQLVEELVEAKQRKGYRKVCIELNRRDVQNTPNW